MKAEELRIGNYVTINNEGSWPQLKDIPMIVVNIGKIDHLNKQIMFPNSKNSIGAEYENGNVYNQFEQFIEAIQITEDWLIKLGFENKGIFVNKIQLPQSPSGTMDGSKEFTIGETRIFNDNGKYYYEIASHYDDYGEYNFTHHLVFLHELQNFHHAFTGEELTINEL